MSRVLHSISEIVIIFLVSVFLFPTVISAQELPTTVPYSQQQENQVPWNMAMVDAPNAWRQGITGQGVDIAVIDTGFYADHPDLTFAGGASVFEDDPWTNDHTGHGTHVSGVIKSSPESPYPGVAPGVNLYGVKVYHEDNMTEDGYPITGVESIIQGIQRAMEFAPDIIVISSGFQGSNEDLQAAVDSAYSQGVVIVAASGNGQASVDYPAAFENVVAVSSINMYKEPAVDISEGPENDFAAPGIAITSQSSPQSAYGYPYATLSGSSQATPHVAGVLALLMDQHNTTALDALEIMKTQAEDLSQPNLFGHGLVRFNSNAEQADGQVESEVEELPNTPEEASATESEITFETNPIQEVTQGDQIIEDTEVGGIISVDANGRDQLYVTESQVDRIIEKNIQFEVAHDDFTWIIPPTNLERGNLILRFTEEDSSEFDRSEDIHSPVYTFDLIQNGDSRSQFIEPMSYRFHTNQDQIDQADSIYRYSPENGWNILDTVRTTDDSYIGTQSPVTGTMAAMSESEDAQQLANVFEDRGTPRSMSAGTIVQSRTYMIVLGIGVLAFLILLTTLIKQFLGL